MEYSKENYNEDLDKVLKGLKDEKADEPVNLLKLLNIYHSHYDRIAFKLEAKLRNNQPCIKQI